MQTTSPHQGVIVVTGGSRGIGRAVALALAGAGHSICLSYQSRAEDAERVVQELRTLGVEALAVAEDVSKPDAVARLFDAADKLGPLRGLVNNAGVTGEASRVENLPPDELRKVFEVNVFGVFYCAREAVRRMAHSHGGRGGAIVTLSSGASKMGSPGSHVHYAASKGAVDTFTLGLAREVARDGIRVNAVRAGVVDTEIHSTKTPERLQALLAAVPMGRMASAEEIAASVAWLMSDGSSYMTGSIIDVAGGL